MHPQTRPWPIEEMRKWYENDGLTIQEIADRLCSAEWQVYWRHEWGKEYYPSQKVVNKRCRKNGFAMRGRGAPLARNGNWGGGRIVDKQGYILIRTPGHPYATKAGYVRLHRLIMEEKLGRYLEPNEVVHHIDDDPGNNDPDNLMLFENQAVHVSTTMTGKVPSSRIAAAHAARATILKQRRQEAIDRCQTASDAPA